MVEEIQLPPLARVIGHNSKCNSGSIQGYLACLPSSLGGIQSFMCFTLDTLVHLHPSANYVTRSKVIVVMFKISHSH